MKGRLLQYPLEPTPLEKHRYAEEIYQDGWRDGFWTAAGVVLFGFLALAAGLLLT